MSDAEKMVEKEHSESNPAVAEKPHTTEKTELIPFAEPVETDAETPSAETGTFEPNRDTTSLDALIFTEEEVRKEPIRLDADSSPEFRRKLNICGNRYQLERLIATGGFSQVFLAKDRVLGRKAVVKTLKTELLADDDTVQKFITEAKLNAQLDHPSIVALYSLDTDSTDGLHLAMQHVKGITLKEYLFRNRNLQLSYHYPQSVYNKQLRERLELFLHVCDAIEYTHNRKVIHCDLKPENIMISRYSEVYIMDWGIACFEGTQHDTMAGTPAYMAPERIATGISNQQSDVFSLGMILNEVATLRPQLTGESTEDVLRKIKTGAYLPSTPIDPKCHISKVLRAIIEKARAGDPRERYATVKELAADVRHFMFHEEVKACPDSPLEKAFHFLYHHRVTTAFLILLCVMAAAAVVVWEINERNKEVQALKDVMIHNLRLQTNVEALANETAGRIIRIQEQLLLMGNTFRIFMDNEKGTRGNTEKPVRYYMNSDYDPSLPNQPSGLLHTPFYKNPITLMHGTLYSFNDNLSKAELQMWFRRFNALYEQNLSAILLNIPSEEMMHWNKESNLKSFLQHGSLIRNVLFYMKNGVVYCFPGSYYNVPSADSFIPRFIRRELRSHAQLVWSDPFADSSDHVVISCWRSLSDDMGNIFGGIALNISYEALVRPIFEQAEKEKHMAIYGIVDSEEHLIFTTNMRDDTYFRKKGKKKDLLDLMTMTGQNSFRYPQLIRHIHLNPQEPQFDMRLDGKMYRISWAKIPYANWLLLQRVPVEKVTELDKLLNGKKAKR